MAADVAERRRTQQCVNQCVQEHVGVAVSKGTAFRRQLNAADYEPATAFEPVDVVADSDAHSPPIVSGGRLMRQQRAAVHRSGSPAQQRFGEGEVVGSGHLEIARRAEKDLDAVPVRLHQHRVVGDVRGRAEVGVQQ